MYAYYIFVQVIFLTFLKLYFSRHCQSPCILTPLRMWGNKTSWSTPAHIPYPSVSQAKDVLERSQINKANILQPSMELLKHNLLLLQPLWSSLTFIGGGCCLKVAVWRVSCFLATWSCWAAAAAAARDSGMGGSWGSVCHSAFCFSK